MENQGALYRKYRPQAFKDVRNQDHIVSVLEGAIKKRMIPHALLFTGSRGTGKTTVARIFAREIGAKDVDIYEIDAASNRGIDDIRELKSAVHTLPYESPYKVYIIDEVHMLTKEAFNALLKTLEEPPAHVIFILATTEKDKLLDTITSRCQLFSFKTPSREELRDTVLKVAKSEKFTLEKAAADIIAHAADGSYRDALGITQKVMMASSDKAIEVDEIARIVGAPRQILLQDVVRALATGETETGLAAVRAADADGVDMRLFMRLLLERVRAVLLFRHRAGTEDELFENYTPEERELLAGIAKDRASRVNSKLLVRLLEAAEQIGKGSVPALPLELALIELGDDTQVT
jgi:DNA polymerase-3 subunit gamma/tau